MRVIALILINYSFFMNFYSVLCLKLHLNKSKIFNVLTAIRIYDEQI